MSNDEKVFDPPVLIKNGKVANANGIQKSDILLQKGKIAAIEESIVPPDNALVIDAEYCYILPGGIDPHTHLDFEFMGTKSVDDFYTGTRAAVQGGTTTIIDFIVPTHGEGLCDAFDRYMKKADGMAVCDYAFHMALVEWNESVEREINIVVSEKKVNSFKVFMAYKDMLMMDDGQLYHVFKKCTDIGALPMVHAENGSVIAANAKFLLEKGITGPEGHELSRPAEVEAEATNRACVIATLVNSPLYVVHVMTDAAAKVIADHKKKGKIMLIGETLAAAVASDGAPQGCSFRVGAAHVMSPPISRDPENKIKIMKRLANDELSCTGSDNCTFSCKQKETLGKGDFTKIPNGVNGVEDRMGLIWEFGVKKEIISVEKFVAITSTNAAKIFNLYPKKGVLAVGSDADVVIWNPAYARKISSKTHLQACDYNIFEGMTVSGRPWYVFVRGKMMVEKTYPVMVKGYGKFLPTNAYSSDKLSSLKKLFSLKKEDKE